MGRIEEPLALESRRRIYEFIRGHPGAFVRQMERELDMQPGLLSYHLYQLEKGELIKAQDDGYRKCYYIKDTIMLAGRKAVALLRQPTTHEILLLLLRDGTLTFKQLLTEMSISKSTLSHHMKRLVASELVKSAAKERETAYSLVDPEIVLDALAAIKHEPEGGAVERFAQVWGLLATKGR
ncbi:MAG: helix-turn-helix domain-containing protein [Methanomassiliicoccales archaeon]